MLKLSAWTMIPVIALELALAPFWFPYDYDAHPWLPDLQMDLTGAYIPLYLAAVGIAFLFFYRSLPAFSVLSVLLGAMLAGIFLYYAIWGISAHRFWDPDAETVLLLRHVALIAFAITLLPTALAAIIRYVIYARQET